MKHAELCLGPVLRSRWPCRSSRSQADGFEVSVWGPWRPHATQSPANAASLFSPMLSHLGPSAGCPAERTPSRVSLPGGCDRAQPFRGCGGTDVAVVGSHAMGRGGQSKGLGMNPSSPRPPDQVKCSSKHRVRVQLLGSRLANPSCLTLHPSGARVR